MKSFFKLKSVFLTIFFLFIFFIGKASAQTAGDACGSGVVVCNTGGGGGGCACGSSGSGCNSCNTCQGMCDCYGVCDLGQAPAPGSPAGGGGGGGGGGPVYTSVPLCFGCGNPYWDGTKYICPPSSGVCWGYLCGQQVDTCWPSFCPNTDMYTGCSPACGQASICGAACPATDAAIPNDVPWTSPAYPAACPPSFAAINPVAAATGGNFSQVGTGQYSGLPDQWYGAPHGAAQAFTPTQTGVLQRIAVSFDASYSALGGSPLIYLRGVTWSIRADANGAPGSTLQSGSFQPLNGATNTIYINNGGITLNQGTQYWLVMTPTQYYYAANVYWTWRRSWWGSNPLPTSPSGEMVDYTFTNNGYTYMTTANSSTSDLDFAISVVDPACVAAQQAQPPVTVTPDGAGKVTVSWGATTGAQGYELEIYPTGTSCADPAAYCPYWGTSGNTVQIQGLPVTTTSYTFTPTTGSYTFRVRAVKTACVSALSSITYGSWTPPVTFLVKSGISGNGYLDLNSSATYDLATGKCIAGGGEVAQDLSATGGSISASNSNGTFPGTITGSTYNIPNVTQTAGTSISLSLDPTQWSCVCPVGCTYSGVTPGFSSSGYSFFITGTKPPWYQTKNGLLYAGQSSGTAIKSDIPVTCSAATGCTPYLTTKDTDGIANTSGIPITGGGGIATAFANLSEDQRADSAVGSTSTGPTEDYAYFFTQLYSMGSNPATDFTGTKPGAAPTNQKAYYAAGDVSTSGAWTVNSGESYVIFVNGNLTVTAPITVAQGGFLAFIVKGNIIVQNTVGQAAPTSTVSVMDGLYYADGTLTIQGGRAGGDLKFVGEGSFVARQGVQLQRAYGSLATNQTKPTELFTFRPDFIVNMPARMLKPQMLWQEVN